MDELFCSDNKQGLETLFLFYSEGKVSENNEFFFVCVRLHNGVFLKRMELSVNSSNSGNQTNH